MNNRQISRLWLGLAAVVAFWLLQSLADLLLQPGPSNMARSLWPAQSRELWLRALAGLILFAAGALIGRYGSGIRRRRDGQGDAYIALDRDWNITRFTPGAGELLGLPQDQALGRSFWDAFPEAVSFFYKPLRQALLSGEDSEVQGPYPPAESYLAIRACPSADGLSLHLRDVSREWQQQRALEETTERLQAVLDSASDGIITIDQRGCIETFNPSAERIFGYSAADVIGQNVSMLMPAMQAGPHERSIAEFMRSGVSRMSDGQPRTVTALGRDGANFPLDVSVSAMYLGQRRHFVGIVRNVSERVATERELQASRESLARAQEIANLGSWHWDLQQDRLTWSDQTFRIFGLEPGSVEPTYQAFLERVHPDDRAQLEEAVNRALETGLGYAMEHRVVRPDGQWRIVIERGEVAYGDDGPVYMDGIVQDVTERKHAEEQIEFMANFDPLTGLPNRSLLQYRLQQAISQSRREGRLAAVMVLNLDRFKTINDTLGHACGDQVLNTVAKRIETAIRDGDTVARLGSDEFAVLLDGIDNIDQIGQLAGQILECLQAPIEAGGHEVFMTATVGITVCPHDGNSVELLLRNADAALHRTKQTERDSYQFFTPDMTAGAMANLRLKRDLHRALDNGEFKLRYHPQLDARTGAVVGVEALLRWQHPTRGLITPAEFIPMLEDTGLILPTGQWVLETACQQAREWERAGLPPLRMAVNLSALQFRQSDLTAQVAHALERSGLAPQRLELEITESLLMENIDQAIRALHELERMGVQVSIDDFGTGYSSMSYLQRFPVDTLKIDRSFITDITRDADSAAIAKAIIALGHSLRLRLIAEGVETEEQLDFLRENGCHEAQGFLFTPPLPASEFRQWLEGSPLQAGASADQ